LDSINITQNRLTGAIPALRSFYPALKTLLAADNKFTKLSAESLRGMHTVNLSSNNIESLPAELGLLWDEGLRNLEVGSNAFRVPNYRILEKGTEATLRYLRDKLPAKETVAVVNGDVNLDDEVD
jgi:Leucine-rich repeat (LRR) protein